MSYEDIPTTTFEDRKIEELTDRLNRKPTEVELAVKEVAEEEAYEQIKATPSGHYVMDEILGAHRKRVMEKLGREPSEREMNLFRDIFKEEVAEENMDREMRM